MDEELQIARSYTKEEIEVCMKRLDDLICAEINKKQNKVLRDKFERLSQLGQAVVALQREIDEELAQGKRYAEVSKLLETKGKLQQAFVSKSG